MSREDQRRKKVQHLNEFRTVNVGETTKLINCCREVKLGVCNLSKGTILNGWNTLSDTYEEWEVVDVRPKTMNSIVRRIK